MGNARITRTLFALVKNLPFFDFSDLAPVEKNRTYLAVISSRYAKSGRFVRLKKDLYVTREYLDETRKNGAFNFYLEFLAGVLYRPSYLSLEYVLSRHNLITEFTVNFTSVTTSKTKYFSNNLGKFFYHTVKEGLFTGFDITREGNFTILKATRAKALFDFLYLRKNLLPDEKAVEELRLNLDNLTAGDLRELKKYVNLEGSGKMKNIFNFLKNLWKR